MSPSAELPLDAAGPAARLPGARRVLLLDVDNQRRWIGSRVGPAVHIPPVALLLLGAVLRRERPEVEVRVATTSLDAPDDASLRALLDGFRPDVVGLRCISFFLEELKSTAKSLRAWDPSVPVICGGPVAAALGADLLVRCPDLAMAMRGEGEFVLPELIGGAAAAKVPGMIVREGGKVLEAPPRPLIADLDALPFPDYSLVDLSAYESRLSYAYNHRRQGVLFTSRGCIFTCTYCFQPSGVGARYRSAGSVLREIRELHDRHGIEDFYVIDDLFNVKRSRAAAIFRALRDEGPRVRLYFVNGLRADLMDDELVDLMVEAGTVWVTYAIETVDPDTQKLIRKELNMPRAEAAIRRSQEKGIVVNINTMFGFPRETRAMADRTIEWLSALDRPSLLPYHFALKGYEGCEIVEQAAEAGWDMPSFMAEANKAYNHVPRGSPTFPRAEMIAHMVDYHTRLGLGSAARLKDALATLRAVGYTERDLVDMYTVLLNRTVKGSSDIVPLGDPMRSGDTVGA